LGQLLFVEKGDGSAMDPSTDLHHTDSAELFGISKERLQELCCTQSIKQPGKEDEKIVIEVDKMTAKVNRDTMAKLVYDNLFTWLVKRVNISIAKPQDPKHKFKSIGLLDIFGFEIFEENSFEQLCINYTNEKLQQHFNQHMFKIEQTEYDAEKISWEHIKFVDNAECIKMLEGGLSIFKLLDDATRFKADSEESDRKFLSQIQQHFKTNPYMLQGNMKFRGKGFGVNHYAGGVYYTVAGFVDKNKNSVNKEMNLILSQSKNTILKKIFKGLLDVQTAKTVETVSKNFTSQLGSLVVH
jgi:myosin heavy subunit